MNDSHRFVRLPRPGRRLLRFNIRTLLVLLLLAAVASVVLGPWVRWHYAPRPITSEDIFEVYIEGVLANANGDNGPPTDGFPIHVRGDGTVPLPLIGNVNVAGLTRKQARVVIIEAYVSRNIVQKKTECRVQ